MRLRGRAPRRLGQGVHRAWGHACLTPCAAEPFFAVSEVRLLAGLCPHIGDDIRTSLLLSGGPALLHPNPRQAAAQGLAQQFDGLSVQGVVSLVRRP